jgi:hypothetical protein
MKAFVLPILEDSPILMKTVFLLKNHQILFPSSSSNVYEWSHHRGSTHLYSMLKCQNFVHCFYPSKVSGLLVGVNMGLSLQLAADGPHSFLQCGWNHHKSNIHLCSMLNYMNFVHCLCPRRIFCHLLRSGWACPYDWLQVDLIHSYNTLLVRLYSGILRNWGVYPNI